MKALHIYATTGKRNSGDFFLGPSTKCRFENIINKKVNWSNFNVRKKVTEKDIQYFNTFDYIVVGGGGLFLPDTNPNDVSCWQWPIDKNLINKIQSKIYVISVGLNWFFEQDIRMSNRNNSNIIEKRKEIFKQNIDTLIEKSSHFSMRHNGDIKELLKFVKLNNSDKIMFEFCPVIEYVESKFKNNFSAGEYICFEIKDDRPNRRYIGTTRDRVYNILYKFILELKSRGEKIAIMSHDGSMTFAKYLNSKGFKDYKFLNNTIANQNSIIDNYKNVKKLYCSAGHSQMTAYALGLDFYSLVSHNKLKYFMDDTNKSMPSDGCYVKDLTLEKLLYNL